MDKEIDRKLENKNVKPTAMRELILDALGKQKVAISLKQLEEMFAQSDKSTLYRTLKTFEEKKIIHCIDDGTGSLKYAACDDTCMCNPSELHVHFHCTKCGQTYCLTDIPIPEIFLPKNFVFNKANFVIKGLCDNCNK
jgi:Fur family ferric uptake transcriptional regulator